MESVAKQQRPQPVATAPAESAPGGAGFAGDGRRPQAGASATKRKPFLILGVIALVVLVGVGGLAVYNHGKESTDDAQIEADVVPIAPRIAGQVKRVTVLENQQVKKGDLLVELDDADYAARFQQAQAEVETAQAQAIAADAQADVAAASARGGFSSAQAQLTGSAASVGNARSQIAAASAGLKRAEADASKAQLDLKRAQELRASNVIPQQRLDDAKAANDMAQAGLLQARANLAAAEDALRGAESRVGETRGKVQQSSPVAAQIAAAQAGARLAHARVQSAQAALELARLQLSYAKIFAQDDGMVSRLTVHEGQLVQAGQPMMALVPTETYVVANFKETQIGDMKPGQNVDVDIDAFPGRTLHGKLESLSGGTGSRFSLLPPDNASGNFVKVVQRIPVRIAWVDPPKDLPLRAGLSADVTVHVK
ncbi:MAG: HlyD family secretion protein [Myxococcales bacterium]